MKLVVQSFITLDGVMQAPGGPDEDRDGNFAYGGWLHPFWSDDADAVVDDSTSRLDALRTGGADRWCGPVVPTGAVT